MFPVTVTQQSPATVSMETYQVTTAPMVAKVPKHRIIIKNNNSNQWPKKYYIYSLSLEPCCNLWPLLVPHVHQVVVSLEELENEGLLMSWNLSKQPSFSLNVLPCKQQTVRTFDTSVPAAGGWFLTEAALSFTGSCVFKTPAIAMQMFYPLSTRVISWISASTPCFACMFNSFNALSQTENVAFSIINEHASIPWRHKLCPWNKGNNYSS